MEGKAMNTGYNIREGSTELARRRHLRVVTDHDRDVAGAMLSHAAARRAARAQRSTLSIVAQFVLDVLATPKPFGRKPW